MKAMILAGGLGTRLKEVVRDRPKPMALIVGKPFLEHQIYFLKDQGIEDIVLTVHYMAEHIKSYFGTGHRFGVEITYSEEETPLGTAGAIKKAEKYIDDTFLVLNGDTFSQIDLKKFLEFHESKRSNFSLSLVKLESEESIHYGNVIMDGSKIIDFSEKETKEGKTGLINRGIYIFEPQIFESIKPEKNVSLEKEIFPELAKKNKLYGYLCEGYFMDIGRPETYEQLKKYFLESFFITKDLSVRDAMEKINKTRTDMLLVVDGQKKLLGVLNDKIIKDFLLRGKNLESRVEEAMIKQPSKIARTSDDDEKVYQMLLSGVNRLPVLDDEERVQDVKFRVEEVKSEVFPILRGKSPLRISFAGGGTDVPYFFEKYGGVVISATIDKYCHATLAKRADSRIVINSDLGKETIINPKKIEYNGEFDLIKAIVNLMKPNFGFELYLYNDLPPGRGLGSSASLSVLVTSLLSQLQNTNYDDYKIAEIAHDAEHEELEIKGGWQDQYAAVSGGFNFIEFGKEKNLIYPLRLKEGIIEELNEHLSLCYVGQSHFSGNLHKDQERFFKENEGEMVSGLNKLKDNAISIKEYLLTGELEKIGGLLHESWEIKRGMSKEMSNPKIDELYELGIKNGVYGGKLLGAGGGGYILFFHSPKKRNQLKKAIEESGRGITNFNFESKGTQTWYAKCKF